MSANNFSINYTISFPNPCTHYIDVEMTIGNIQEDTLNLVMPVWTPGSYLVREYSKNIVSISAKDSKGKDLTIDKLTKNKWFVETKTSDTITVSYKVYANEESVRTSVVDVEHAHINGASVFLYVEDDLDLPATLKIIPDERWSQISTALARSGNQKWVRKIKNYDELADSPIEIGNHDVIKFKAGGIPHELAIVGKSNADTSQLVKDLKRIVDEAVDLMGDQPCDKFLFILQNTENRYNGLEHLFSTTCQLPRWDYYPRKKYQASMGLFSHEYFHLWNVKRFRPETLGPFDYTAENYTRLLWFVEGTTSYYDDYLLYKSDIFTEQEYLDVVANMLSIVVNTPGDTVQSLADASFDAWIKYYRRHENTTNTDVSYYQKGATVVEAMNCIILKESNGKYSFDDVIRSLYHDYLKFPEKGYSEDDVLATVERYAGKSMKRFFNDHIYGAKAVNYKKYFHYLGLDLLDLNAKSNEVNWGWSLKWKSGTLSVNRLNSKYGAYQGGLNTGDEILAINGYRTSEDYEKLIQQIKIGEQIKLLISRKGIIKELVLTATKDQDVRYQLRSSENADKSQKKLQKIWLSNQ